MLLTVEAMTDEEGNLQLLEPITLPKGRRVFVTILDEVATLPHSKASEPEIPQDWQDFFDTLDELAEEDDLINPNSISATEEFLQSRR
jgi:hypothetical protein